jgi:ribose/xylose/arabinose/galactoside ABC-type transport system permease subunit
MFSNPAAILRTIALRYSSLIFLILFWLGLGLASPDFLTPSNILNVALQTSILAIVAMGMTFAMLTAGIDLSVGSVVALTSALAAGLAAQSETLPRGAYAGQSFSPVIALVLALAAGAVLGALNGTLIVRGGIPPFVATLAMLAAARGLTLVYTGGYVIPATDPVLTFIGAGQIGPIPIPVIVMVLLFAGLWFILTQTRFGLHVYAVGGNEETTRLAGVHTKAVVLGAYIVSGLMAAIGGVILMGRLNSAQPNVAVGFELDAIAAPVIGGTSLFGGVGTLQGTLIGAFIMGTLSNGMNLLGADPYLQQVIKGLVFVLAVAWNFYTKRK